jgi:ribosomal protein S17E
MKEVQCTLHRLLLLDLIESYDRKIKLQFEKDKRIVEGVIKGISIKRPEVYINLYDCKVTVGEKTKSYKRVRVPLSGVCEYKFL